MEHYDSSVGVRYLVDSAKTDSRIGCLPDLLFDRLQAFVDLPVVRAHNRTRTIVDTEDKPCSFNALKVRFVGER